MRHPVLYLRDTARSRIRDFPVVTGDLPMETPLHYNEFHKGDLHLPSSFDYLLLQLEHDFNITYEERFSLIEHLLSGHIFEGALRDLEVHNVVGRNSLVQILRPSGQEVHR